MAFFGVGFASFILFISFVMAHSVQSSDGMAASSRGFYFDNVVLPDHSAYPVIAGIDKAVLLFSDESRKDVLKLSYADRRLGYAVELLRKGQHELAIATITKSQKYVLEVAHNFVNGSSMLTKQEVSEYMESHIQDLKMIQNYFGLTDVSSISLLIEEEIAVLQSVYSQ